jgi:hypothetical protein
MHLHFSAAQTATLCTKSSGPKRGPKLSILKQHAVFVVEYSLSAKGCSFRNTFCCRVLPNSPGRLLDHKAATHRVGERPRRGATVRIDVRKGADLAPGSGGVGGLCGYFRSVGQSARRALSITRAYAELSKFTQGDGVAAKVWRRPAVSCC